jgi:cell wall-associated NlpC family hydrolase
MQQLGTPYVWGGSGPGGFDCSGLASYAYSAIGKSVPHYTGAIWSEFPKVSNTDLQAGDMVFFNGGGHMGIYIGGGQYVHAPHTGDVVKVSKLGDRSDYMGAVRA